MSRTASPKCIRCDVYMVWHSTQTVEGPLHAASQVQVYECPKCRKIAAQASASSGSENEAA